MASRRKPLDDARKRLNEKLSSIDEHAAFIQNSVTQITAGVKKIAQDLLGETNKTKFLGKYRAVNQALEKCLDDLLLISETICSLDDQDQDEDEEEGGDDDEDEKEEDKGCSSTVECKESEERPAISSPPTEDELAPKTNIQVEACPKTASCGIEPKDDGTSSGFESESSHVSQVPRPTHNTTLPDFSPQPADITAQSQNVKPDTAEQTPQPADIAIQKSQKYKSDPTTQQTEIAMPQPHKPPEYKSLPGKLVQQNQSSLQNTIMTASIDNQNAEKLAPILPDQRPCKPKEQELTSTVASFDDQNTRQSEYTLPDQQPCKPKEQLVTNTVVSHDDQNTRQSEYTLPNQQLCKPNEHLVKRENDNEQLQNIVSEQKSSGEGDSVGGQSGGEVLVPERSFRPVVVPNKKDATLPNKKTSPTEIFAGDLIEEALKGCSSESSVVSASPLTKKARAAFRPFKFPNDDTSLKVAVREIVSPAEFWIQQINGDLDLLMEQMCVFFSKRAKKGDKGGMSRAPEVGAVCCGKCTEDDVWYRAVVSAVIPHSATVEVLYVDEGTREILPLSKLRSLDARFFKLPCQSLFCSLSGIQLNNDVSIEKANDWFKRRVSGETLEAVLSHVTTDSSPPGAPVPIHLYIRPHNVTSPCKIQNLKLVFNIHEMMIREGLSKRVSSPSNTDDTSPTSSYSDSQSRTRTGSMLSSSSYDVTPAVLPSPSHIVGAVNQLQTVPDDVVNRAHDTPEPVVSAAVPASPPCCYSNGSRVPPPPVIQLDFDGSLFMLVSHVINPGEFYAHVISRDAGQLDILMNEMNRTYGDTNAENVDQSANGDFSPRVGDFCCAKFSADGAWYRAVILQLRHTEKSTAEVFYIDFGNIESVEVTGLRHLLPRFMDLPIQVVRCSLADIQPKGSGTDLDDDVFDNKSERQNSRTRRGSHPKRRSPRGTRGRYGPRPPRHENAIAIAAGDEDTDEDLLDTIVDPKDPPSTDRRSRTSISEDINKSRRRSSTLSDTAVELFERVWSGRLGTGAQLWTPEATALFKNLTKNTKKLVGFVVPWDSRMVNDIASYPHVTDGNLPNLGPVLVLNLYDVCGDRDVFINGAMVEANVAVFTTAAKEKVVRVVKISEQDLTGIANSLTAPPANLAPGGSTNLTCSTNSTDPASPTSPTTDLLDAWNPMSHDHKSFRNTYTVNTDNMEVAIKGYEDDRGRICRYFRSKYGCYQGSRCPNKHVREDASEKTLTFTSLTYVLLPYIGAWVAVRVTAIYDPSHFCVQMPFGSEPLDAQIIKSRSGKETSGEENAKNLADLMEQIASYSKTLRHQQSIAPFSLGELAIVRYSTDNNWYRARIHEEMGGKYKVGFVDYGFYEWVERTDVFPIIPQFLHLPFQAVECVLANVSPSTAKENQSKLWSAEATSHFTTLVEDKILVCQVLLTYNVDHTMVVNLYDTCDDHEVNIGQAMIDCGLAELPYRQVKQPTKSSLLEQPLLIERPG